MKEKDVLTVEKRKNKAKKGLIIGLSVAVGILSASTIGFGVAYGCTQAKMDDYGVQLENVYQKNLYDLVESVNNTETKLSKVLSADSGSFQKKMLMEVAQVSKVAESSISSLPISQNKLADSVKFINQMGAYTQTLADKLSQGKNLSQEDLDTLEKLYDSVADMKEQINKFVKKVQKNYSILQQSLDIDAGDNNFTIEISKIKGEDVDYPAMIYDGPFSDAELDMTVKGLKGDMLSKEECKKQIEKTFKNYVDIDYSGEINSRFETFAYHVTNTDNQKLYVQVSKIGGHILTVSGNGTQTDEKVISQEDAEKIAIDFAKENGINNPKIVWKQSLQNKTYLNIAPTENGIVLYPDLVKVKVDLGSGTVIGYDASNYFLNHVARALKKPSHTAEDFEGKISKEFLVTNKSLVLAPLDYSREVICFEYQCEKQGQTYYIYLNADTGKEENVLKVIETDDGSKLM